MLMKETARFIIIVMIIISLSGFVVITSQSEYKESNGEEDITYISKISKEKCSLCSDVNEILLSYWRENNVGVIDLNTFEVIPININRYSSSGNLIKEYAGHAKIESLNAEKYSVWGMTHYDRGYFSGEVSIKEIGKLDMEKIEELLCTECLDAIMKDRSRDEYFNIGIINFSTREIKLLEKRVSAFTMDDYYISCEYRDVDMGKGVMKFDLLVFFCPIRFEK